MNGVQVRVSRDEDNILLEEDLPQTTRAVVYALAHSLVERVGEDTDGEIVAFAVQFEVRNGAIRDLGLFEADPLEDFDEDDEDYDEDED